MPPPLLVTNLTNLRYLTGLSMSAGVLLLSGRKCTLFVDGRYWEMAQGASGFKRQVSGNGLQGARGPLKVLPIDDLAKILKRYRRIRFEAEDVSAARLARWKRKFRGVRFLPSEGIIEEQRRRKRPTELRAIRRACHITDAVLREVPAFLKIPTTEQKVAWAIEKTAREHGADAMAFETIVAFGPHTSRPHHRPTERKLRHRDIVQIDMGVKVHGYCSDCSRVFFTGKPTEEQRQIYELLVKIVRECTRHTKVGATNRSLDAFARTMLKNEHIPTITQTLDAFFLHSLGHGIGLEIHEGVNLTSKRSAKRVKLLPNEVITIEPGIYFEGKWGMRIEDTVLVTRKGGMKLTGLTKFLK
jgi:Xaa-Pro aminopeptidase